MSSKKIEMIINNSFSKIEGLTADAFSRLRKKLSYTVDAQAAFFSGAHRPRIKYCIDMKGTYPTGLAPRVEAFLLAEGLSHAIVDKRGPLPTPGKSAWIKLEAVKPYPAQITAVFAAVVATRGIISMPTGTGKSYVIALLIGQQALNTLVVVPSLEIKKQLAESLLEAMGSLRNVTIENIDSKALQTAKGFDCLIVDEAHHVAAATYQKLNKTAWAGIRYRFFLTATPFRNQTEETLLFEGIAGSVVYQLTYKDAIKQGLIVPVEAYYLEIPKQNTDAFTWAQVYSELVVRHDARNDIIAVTALRLASLGKSTLVLVKEVAHGTALAAKTGLPFVHGQDDESRDYIQQFNRGEIKVLIGTEGILGEGVDTKPCEYVIIAGLGKAKSAFMQKVGRGVRRYCDKESCKVILIKDLSHKFTARHFREQCAILKEEYGITPSKIEI